MRLRVLVAAISWDQERRWQQGEPRRLEVYLQAWPDLRDDDPTMRELIEAEIRTRRILDDPPTREELWQRFPKHADRIDLFALQGEGYLPAANDDTPSHAGPNADTPGADGPPWAPAEVVGETIGHFLLQELVGQGRFGGVWKAYDQQLDRLVAFKIPHRSSRDDAEAEAFLAEARTAAQVEHRWVVRVYGADRTAATPFRAQVIAPAYGAVLRSAQVEFRWSEVPGATQYACRLGGSTCSTDKPHVMHDFSYLTALQQDRRVTITWSVRPDVRDGEWSAEGVLTIDLTGKP